MTDQVREANTKQASGRPTLEKMFLVCAGVEAWTREEQAWMSQHQDIQKMEQWMRRLMGHLYFTETLSEKQIIES